MKKVLIIIIVFFWVCPNIEAQGKLEKAEESLSKKEKRSYNSGTRSRSRDRHSYHDNNDGDYYFDSLGEAIALFMVEIGLYASYYTMIESPEELNHAGSKAAITKHPYANSNKGNYSYVHDEDTRLFRTTISNRFISESSKLYGNHINIDTKFLGRIGFEADYLQLWEENTNFGSNTLAIFTAMAKYHRVRTERFNAWWGLGALYVDGTVDEWGFSYGLGGEWFFAKPLSLETNFYGSSINQGSVNKFTASLHHHYKNYRFTGGYQHLKIGSLDISSFSAGVGISF